MERAFPGERRRRLWRLDRLGGKLYLLILSEDEPELRCVADQFGRSGQGAWEIRQYAPFLRRIQSGGLYQFRLTANPTVSCSGESGPRQRGRVRAHCTIEYQKKWLLDRAEKHGFALTPDSFTVTGSRWLRFTKGGRRRPVTLLSVTYEGILEVLDADLFREVLTSGMGRGKAYGMGMMTVMRKE